VDKFKVIDLFSGIGGFSLGLEETGHFETVAFCEIEKYPQKILKKHWPDVPIYEDVKNVTAKRLRADGIITNGDRIVVTGGFPCQDLSIAGKQKGITAERSGLWSELHRIIGEIRPDYALVENVSALLSGPGERPGEWFGKILGDLAEIGFDARWYSIQASDMGAPHKRNRVWIVGYPNNNTNKTDSRKTREKEKIQGEYREKGLSGQSGRTSNDTEPVADSDSFRSSIRRTNYANEKKSREGGNNKGRSGKNDRGEFKPKEIEDVANSDSGLCERGGTIGQSGEDKERRLYSEKEEQTTHDLRSKTIGCDTVRGKTEDVPNSNRNGRIEMSNRESGKNDGSRASLHEQERNTDSPQETSVPNSNSERPQGFGEKRHSMGETGLRNRETRRKKNVWASESFICDLVDGLPSELADRVRRKLDDNGIAYRDREVPKLGTGISDRVAKLKALGNSIVPQIATLLGDTIIRHESERNS
jgi:DNA-cytosine methyltransferase